jgi:hypothetical protein
MLGSLFFGVYNREGSVCNGTGQIERAKEGIARRRRGTEQI